MKTAFAILIGLVITAGLVFDRWVSSTVLPPLAVEGSGMVVDREGALLRAYTVADGRWRLPVSLDAVDRGYVAQLIAYEDRRFYRHGGVDPLALVRAAAQALRHGHVVSGGSTLTMQVARLLEDGGTGRYTGKLRQIRLALALERRLTKDQILTLYLNLAPFGGNVEGARAASLGYFGKEPARLTPAQAALLVALPQSPETRRPDRFPKVARAARDRALDRAATAGVLTPDEARAARREPVPEARARFPMLAAPLADRLIAGQPPGAIVATTIDAALQRRLEDLLAERAAALDPRLSAALMVADFRTGDILASVGSPGFLDTARQGFIDMTRARRSPGSTLKPLIYGIAFDEGIAHPETLIEDRPIRFGTFEPRNFDNRFRGTVTIRDALRESLNIPAVTVLDTVGPQRLLARLRRAGARPTLPEGAAPGLAVGLGGLGLSLRDLVGLYAAIARGGLPVGLRETPGPVAVGAAPVLGPVAAWQVADILSGVAPPDGSEPGRIAFKTGTSYGYRDTLAVGFDGAHVIGVWLGRPDGTPMPGALGLDRAAPLLFDAFQRVGLTPLPPPPPNALTVPAAELPQPLRAFHPRGGPLANEPRITFPPDGAELALEPGQTDPGPLVIKVMNGVPPFRYLVDGKPLPAAGRDREVDWTPEGRGFVAISVIDSQGAAARARVFLR